MISVPNGDDSTDDADDLIKHLEKVKASRQFTVYTAAGGEGGIQPDARIKAQGEAALRHGYARGEGRDGGKKVSVSTKSYPQREVAYVEPERSAVDTAIGVARGWITRFRGA